MTPDELKDIESLEKVDRIKVLDLQPGDVIVVEADDVLSNEQCDHVERLFQRVFPGHKVLVCPKDIRIKAARVADPA